MNLECKHKYKKIGEEIRGKIPTYSIFSRYDGPESYTGRKYQLFICENCGEYESKRIVS